MNKPKEEEYDEDEAAAGEEGSDAIAAEDTGPEGGAGSDESEEWRAN